MLSLLIIGAFVSPQQNHGHKIDNQELGILERTVGPPPRNTPGPPERETPTPTTITTAEAPVIDQPMGAYIRLQISPSNQVYWTEIEWQDDLGSWHRVNGWKGNTTAGNVQWFVGPELFQAGPFRWLVFSEENGDFLVTTRQFCLPAYANEIMILAVNLNDELDFSDWRVASCF